MRNSCVSGGCDWALELMAADGHLIDASVGGIRHKFSEQEWKFSDEVSALFINLNLNNNGKNISHIPKTYFIYAHCWLFKKIFFFYQ